MRAAGFPDVRAERDLAGIERVVVGSDREPYARGRHALGGVPGRRWCCADSHRHRLRPRLQPRKRDRAAAHLRAQAATRRQAVCCHVLRTASRRWSRSANWGRARAPRCAHCCRGRSRCCWPTRPAVSHWRAIRAVLGSALCSVCASPLLQGPLVALAAVGCPPHSRAPTSRGARSANSAETCPIELRDGVDLVLDGGELPGVASTVIDLSEYEQAVAGGSCARGRSRVRGRMRCSLREGSSEEFAVAAMLPECVASLLGGDSGGWLLLAS